MTTSAWGVDHGAEISKSDQGRRYVAGGTATGALHPVAGAGYGALTAKKGKRTKAALHTGGGALVGGAVGGMGGAKFGTKGVIAGSALGGGAGGYLGSVNNVQQGRVAGLRKEKYPMERSRKVSKASDNKYTRNEKLTGLGTAATYNTPIGAVAAGMQAKKGKGAKVGGRAFGRGMVEGLGGMAAGAALGRGNPAGSLAGATLGGAAGTAHGTMASMRNSRRKGWMKKSQVSKAFQPKNDKQRKNQANKQIVGGAGLAGLGAMAASRGGSGLANAARVNRIGRNYTRTFGGVGGKTLQRATRRPMLQGAALGAAGVAGTGAGAGFIGSGLNERKKMRVSKAKKLTQQDQAKIDNATLASAVGGGAVGGYGTRAAGATRSGYRLSRALDGGKVRSAGSGAKALGAYAKRPKASAAGVLVGMGAGTIGGEKVARSKILFEKSFVPDRGTAITSSGSADTRRPGVKSSKGKQRRQQDTFTGRKQRSGSLIEAIGSN